MGFIDTVTNTFKKIFPTIKSGGERIEIIDPEARGFTANILIGASVAGIVSLFLVETGLLARSEWVWVPLGIIIFLMTANPIVRLKGFWEMIVIILMFANVMAYTIVYHKPEVTNALLVAMAFLMIVIVVEYPRRFNVK